MATAKVKTPVKKRVAKTVDTAPISYPELANRISEKTKVPMEYVTLVLERMKAEIHDAAEHKRRIEFGRDFGYFESKVTPGRQRYIPSRGDYMDTPETHRIRFVPSASLRRAVKS